MNWKKKIVPIYKKCLNSASRGHGLGKNPVLRKIVKKVISLVGQNSVRRFCIGLLIREQSNIVKNLVGHVECL